MRVFPAAHDQWGVTVDGVEIGPRCFSSYDAWAVGVAESYRQGPGAEREHARGPG